ncbi:MAG: OprD family outer membrane porin [Sulfurimonas sp.]|uniref:OprD family outer membrane porin n=1 Tax=Sulfurimonas sp. TaxID=2022749 RepID=UPI002606E875|nr:OprD family outer membrane porin [Sulfurimonas sp.]MDD3475907.1 OprD family outer membrane porin [Sulfurimonas sp.]
MKKAIKLSLAAALAGSAMLHGADIDVNGYKGGTLDFMLKGIYVIDDKKNGWAPNDGGGYLVKLKYETPDTIVDNLKVGVGMYVNGDGGLTDWTPDDGGKAAGGLVVDKDGKSKALMGELYVSYKHEYFDAKLGRQTLDTPLTKIQVSLMPNFYEAYMLGTNVIDGLRLTAGQITKMSMGSRAATDFGLIGEGSTTGGAATKFVQQGGTVEQARFLSMGKIAGLTGDTDGRTILGATYSGIKNLKADLWAYHSDDVVNDYYAELGYKIPVVDDMAVSLNAQYLMQKDTGNALAGKKDFNMMGAKVALGTKKWGVYTAVNKSGDQSDTASEMGFFNAWGADPAYTSTIFSRNAYRDDVEAYIVGGHYMIMKGMKFMVDYAEYGKSDTKGRAASGPTGVLSANDDAYEIDVALNYKYDENWFFRVFNSRRVSEYNGVTAGGITERRQNHYRIVASYTF